MAKQQMIITKVENQKKNNKRVSIYINDEYSFGLGIDIALKFNLEKGKEIDQSFIDKALKSEEQSKANNYALRLLSFRSRSKKEIIDKMKQKGYDDRVMENTINYLEKYELINDDEFTKEFIKYKSKKLGRRRMKMELKQKGVAENIIDNILDDVVDENKEYDVALSLAQKKMKSYEGDDRNAQYRKLGAYLQRKGFGYDVVSRILKETINCE